MQALFILCDGGATFDLQPASKPRHQLDRSRWRTLCRPYTMNA